MSETVTLPVIAHIRNDYDGKFGVPRQSGLVSAVSSDIVFEPAYRDPQALRGIEDWSHLWLVWQFHLVKQDSWSPTVRPPRLGGNTRVGVFATRSPFRPAPIGLSCVRLQGVRIDPVLGPVLTVTGADLMNGTPILDIKPYLPLADCIPQATGGFTDTQTKRVLNVVCDEQLLERIPARSRQALLGVLHEDPRPAYQDDPQRSYGFRFAGCEVHFRVSGDELTVTAIDRVEAQHE